jgi:hypothetical protein
LRNERRFLTFLTDDETKKERKPKRLFREMLSSEDEVDDDDDEFESARERPCGWVDIGTGSATAVETTEAAAAAASCSLDCRRSARRRRVLSGLRRRGSPGLIMLASHFLHGPFISVGVGGVCNSCIARGMRSGFNRFQMRFGRRVVCVYSLDGLNFFGLRLVVFVV